MTMKFDQDLCLNLQYDFGKMNSTLGSVVPLAMFLLWQLTCILGSRSDSSQAQSASASLEDMQADTIRNDSLPSSFRVGTCKQSPSCLQ